MKMNTITLAFLACVTISNISHAATITLKDGRTFEGNVISQTSDKVVLDASGIKMNFPTEQVDSIDMANSAAEAKAKPKAAPTSATATVEPGTALTIRMSEQVNSRNNKTGARFTATLEANLMVGDVLIAKKGSQVYGVLTNVKKAGRIAGSAQLVLELTEISIDGNMHQIATQPISGSGENTARKSVGGTARAAAVGGLIDGSDGAKTGAKVGLAAAVLTKGSDIQIPSGTLLDFVLRTPFKL